MRRKRGEPCPLAGGGEAAWLQWAARVRQWLTRQGLGPTEPQLCEVMVLLCKVDMDGLFLIAVTPFTPVPSAIPPATILCGLRGLVLAEARRLALRECWTPCTMDVCR